MQGMDYLAKNQYLGWDATYRNLLRKRIFLHVIVFLIILILLLYRYYFAPRHTETPIYFGFILEAV